jgi:hypothetical protein
MTNQSMLWVAVGAMALFGGSARAYDPAAAAQWNADNLVDAYDHLGDTWKPKESGWCADSFDELTANHVAPTTKVKTSGALPDPAAWPHGSIPAGTFTLEALREHCRFLTSLNGRFHFEAVAKLVLGHVEMLQPGEFPDSNYTEVKACLRSYAQLTAAGVAPTTQLEFDTNSKALPKFKGTLEEARVQVCEAARNGLRSKMDVVLAPYKKVLKGDKLKMLSDTYPGGFILPGGGLESSDAALLAKASAWFLDLSASDGKIECRNGSIHTVRKYQFNGAGKLVSTTEKQYCGEPPASAFK